MNGVDQLAACGWLVEVRLTIDEGPGFRFFAVAESRVEEAEAAMLRYPGIFQGDVRTARRSLLPEEIARLQLRHHGVRPFRVPRQSRD